MSDRERFEELYTLASQIAAHLPDWQAERPEIRAGDYPPRHCYLMRDDGAGIAIAFVWNQAGRIEISGRYPHEAHGYYRDCPSITLSALRAPENLAREITRRFLPDYLVYWEKAHADANCLRQAQARVRDVAEQCAHTTGVPADSIRYDTDRNSATIYTDVGKITIRYSGTVEINTKSLQPTRALDLLKRLMEANPERRK